MKKVPQWISIRPQRIYNTTEEHESCANEFNNYLLACGYKPSNKALIWAKVSETVNLLSLVIAIHILYTRSCQSFITDYMILMSIS